MKDPIKDHFFLAKYAGECLIDCRKGSRKKQARLVTKNVVVQLINTFFFFVSTVELLAKERCAAGLLNPLHSVICLIHIMRICRPKIWKQHISSSLKKKYPSRYQLYSGGLPLSHILFNDYWFSNSIRTITEEQSIYSSADGVLCETNGICVDKTQYTSKLSILVRCGYSNDQNSLDETTCCAAGVTECIFNVLNVLSTWA